MYKVLNNIQLSKNFKLSEFECNDGTHEVMIAPTLVTLLQQLRDALEAPVVIAAGYRNPRHNAQVGGSPNSRHMKGEAVDIKVIGKHPRSVAVIAEHLGFKGIGVYTHNGQYFTHLDVRPVKSYWMDQPGKILIPVKTLNQIPT